MIDLGNGISLKINQFNFKEWFLNGKRHKEDDPAMTNESGSWKEWWIHGKQHREDGPAIINGYIELHLLDGKHYTKRNWIIEMRKRKLEKLGI